MALQTAQVAVGTTAAELTVRDFGGSSIIIKAPETATLYVGDKTVTALTGYPVAGGSTLALDLDNERVYGVLASGTGTAYVLRTGVGA